ncbi:MAG: glutamine-hydrolyzing carbamoyl-phosphate synthase small subunit [Kiritimatiellaeota bacterium]|nr:glutamine-hydrolyzing carbamoyl-phosphate synthase small subunit [Kiritimatiellota bacterium]
MSAEGKKALIALEDGTVFEGRAFAGAGEVFGELVFNTSMTGYQEILTDPSYHGQIVTLTYPLIGNYGVNPEDEESARPQAAGLIVGECSRIASNFRHAGTLPQYLVKHHILGVDHVDTRAITLHIRALGAMKCVMSTADPDPASLVQKAKDSPGLVGRDLATAVSTPQRFTWTEAGRGFGAPASAAPARFRVAALDCGLKTNQLRMLVQRGGALEVFPAASTADEILGTKPDGFFISNGPGDPAGVPQIVRTVKDVIATGLPTFGICFGHQLLGQAFGGRTYKLKFGHRGANQPVMDLTTRKVEITSQNHGFAVDLASLPDDVETTHINLNDQTSEGLRHKRLPVFSVQYHPEAAPGPHDAAYLFDRFIALMEQQPRP